MALFSRSKDQHASVGLILDDVKVIQSISDMVGLELNLPSYSGSRV